MADEVKNSCFHHNILKHNLATLSYTHIYFLIISEINIFQNFHILKFVYLLSANIFQISRYQYYSFYFLIILATIINALMRNLEIETNLLIKRILGCVCYNLCFVVSKLFCCNNFYLLLFVMLF